MDGAETVEVFNVDTAQAAQADVDKAAAARDEFQKFVPESYRDKEWVKNVSKAEDPRAELFKQYEHAQSLIGQRSGLQVPAADAAPEQWKSFYKAIGVPDDTAPYEYKPVEWSDDEKELGEFITSTRTEGFMADLKSAAQANGITPAQFQALAAAYDKTWVKHYKENLNDVVAQQKAQEVDFDKQADALFGARKNAVIESGKKLMADVAPDLKERLKGLDNNAILVLSAVLDGIRTKYIKEDGFNQGGAASADSLQAMREEGRRLMADPAYSNVMHANHQQAVEAVAAHYKRMGTMR